MDRREQDRHDLARDMDTGKELNSFPQQYIEHDPRGTSEPVYNRNSAYAPETVPHSDLEAIPPSDLEVYLKNEQAQQYYDPKAEHSPTVVSSKPLPPPPAPAYEAVITANGPDGEAGGPEKKRGLSRKKIIIIAIVVGILAVVAIVVGAVVGTRSKGSNDKASSDGNQDLSTETTSLSSSVVPESTSTTTSEPTPSPTSPSVVIPKEEEVKIGSNFTASFSFYGSGDGGDGVSCKSFDNACGIYPESGYAAGVSQNLYGDGLTCGTCWRLRATRDGGNARLRRDPIVVKINEECPAEGYPICGQRDLKSTNQFKAQVNFNLCVDTGASDALFGLNTGVDFATGTAERVDCKEWKGKTKESFRF